MRSYLKNLRITNHLSQEEAAELLGISVSQLRKIESGHRGLSIKMAVQLSKLYGKSIEEIIQDEAC